MKALRAVWLLPALALLGAFLLYPAVRTLMLSFTQQNLASGFDSTFIGAANFSRLLSDSRFHNSLFVTATFTLISVVLEFVLGLVLALAADSLTRGRALVRTMVLIPWTLPTAIIALLWAWIFNDQYGIFNALLMRVEILASPVAWLAGPVTAMATIILADVWKTTPFVFIILLAGLQSIPRDLYEAIEIDGGGPWARFRYVIWPFLSRFAFIALVFRVIQSFALFDLVYVMTGGGPGGSTESVSIYAYQTLMRYLDFGYGSALIVASVAVLAVISTGLYVLLVSRNENVV